MKISKFFLVIFLIVFMAGCSSDPAQDSPPLPVLGEQPERVIISQIPHRPGGEQPG